MPSKKPPVDALSKPKRIYAYMRISTIKQITDGQEYGIMKFARDRNWRIDEWVSEQVSGKTKAADRQLGGLLDRIQTGDTLLIGEVARLGRSTLDTLHSLQILLEKKVFVFAIKEGYEFKDDVQSKFMAFAFSMAAEIERNQISLRTKEALAMRKANGIKLGRPQGSHNLETKLSGKEAEVQKLLDKRVSHASIGRIFEVDRRTVKYFIDTRLKPAAVA